MLTVIVGFDKSGKSRMRSPLFGNLYSVIPSTDVIFSACAMADMADRSRQSRTAVTVETARFMKTSKSAIICANRLGGDGPMRRSAAHRNTIQKNDCRGI